MDEQEAIQQFLGDRPSAEQLGQWRATLEHRLHSLEGELERSRGTAELTREVAQLRKQIEALREEEAITQFVEDSVRVTLAMGTVSEGDDFRE
jgi:hypothetical protein